MQRVSQQGQAELFRRLHGHKQPLVLVNAWDAGSARLLESCGAPAIATTSAAMAWSLGYADGEQLPVRELIDACQRICRVVKVPVSVDLERGFGSSAADVSSNVRALLDVGVVGINIEDGVDPRTGSVYAPGILAERVAAIRSTADEAGVPLFINARTDNYFLPAPDPMARYRDTLTRAKTYIEAGADGIFVPGLDGIEEIAQLASAIARPLNIYVGHGGVPSVAALAGANVGRVSLGCGSLQAAFALTRRIANEAFEQGTYAAMTENMLAGGFINALFAPAEQ